MTCCRPGWSRPWRSCWPATRRPWASTPSQPDIPAHDQALADWLVAHHFTYGLSNYYEGNITTLDSGGRVHLVTVSWGAHKSVPRAYQSECLLV